MSDNYPTQCKKKREAFNMVQQLFMKITPSKLQIKENFFNLIKYVSKFYNQFMFTGET